jgi:ATP synthase protein I
MLAVIPQTYLPHRALYLLLQTFFSMCYNPTGIIKRVNEWGKAMKKNEPPSAWASLALAFELGFVIAIPIALGAIGGGYLDSHVTHTKDVFLLLGLLLGLILGIYGAYRLLAPFLKR